MANKIFQKPKTVKEIRYLDGSISKHNAKYGTAYLLFDPKNITSYECIKGVEKTADADLKSEIVDTTQSAAVDATDATQANVNAPDATESLEKVIYIKERLACMWGNEEIEEYVLVDKSCKDMFEGLCNKETALAHKQDFIKARVGDIVIEYSHKKGMFSRYHYNVWFEYAGTYYYLYIKTCDGGKFKSLMEEFLTDKKTI